MSVQDRQCSYADQRRRDVSFALGDPVFLKVSPTKGGLRFEKQGKLCPKHIGQFEILERVGDVAYKIAFLLSFTATQCFVYLFLRSMYQTVLKSCLMRDLMSDHTYYMRRRLLRSLNIRRRDFAARRTRESVVVKSGHRTDDLGAWGQHVSSFIQTLLWMLIPWGSFTFSLVVHFFLCF